MRNGRPHLLSHCLKRQDWTPFKKNYRPVSNLQYVSKLTERAAVNQLCLHSDCRFPLPPYQSAYTVGHFTETALVKGQSDILLNMLLNIMNYTFGVTGTALSCLNSYHQSRS